MVEIEYKLNIGNISRWHRIRLQGNITYFYSRCPPVWFAIIWRFMFWPSYLTSKSAPHRRCAMLNHFAEVYGTIEYWINASILAASPVARYVSYVRKMSFSNFSIPSIVPFHPKMLPVPNANICIRIHRMFATELLWWDPPYTYFSWYFINAMGFGIWDLEEIPSEQTMHKE